MSLITTSVVFKSLKATLDEIITDKTDGVASGLIYPKYMETKRMEENYEDDQEVSGLGLATERSEGQSLTVSTILEGVTTRYIARNFGLQMQVAEEALEDSKHYPKYIDAAKRLKRAVYKTQEVDAANVLNRATNTSYAGGDGQPLASASHTLPGGGTFSNTLATAFSPSRAALIVVDNNLSTMVSHDGITEGYMAEKIVCPQALKHAWLGIVGSEKVPESANNEINTVKGLDLEVVPVKYWTGSTTNWLVTTDADGGLQFRKRKDPSSRSWVDNDTVTLKYGITARWSRGWSNPRGVYFSNA